MRTKSNAQLKRQLYKRYLILAKDFYNQAEPEKMSPYIGDHRKGYLIASLIFIALAVESFINEFGYDFVEGFDDYENIKTLQKIIILPQISKNPNIVIKKSDNKYALLRELFQYRNFFVHQKPKFRDLDSPIEKQYETIDFKLLSKHYKNVIAIMKLFQDKFNIYEADKDWISEHPENIAI